MREDTRHQPSCISFFQDCVHSLNGSLERHHRFVFFPPSPNATGGAFVCLVRGHGPLQKNGWFGALFEIPSLRDASKCLVSSIERA